MKQFTDDQVRFLGAVAENIAIVTCMTVGIILAPSVWWLLLLFLCNTTTKKKDGDEK